LVSSARYELVAEERAAALAAQYRQGLRQLDARAWRRALEVLEQVERQDPSYRDVQALLRRVHRELARTDERPRDLDPAPRTRTAW
jgi:Tfp pilus assembly protein PilF